MRISKKVQEQLNILRSLKRVPMATLHRRYNEVLKVLPTDPYDRRRALYLLLHPEVEFRGSCAECGTDTPLVDFNIGFRKFCSRGCSNRNIETLASMKANHLERYGVESPMQRKEVRAKVCSTMKERHGVAYTAQSDILSKKLKKTLKENYGVEYPIQSKEIRKRVDATCKERYGCKNPWGSDIVRDKIKTTMVERYGVEHSNQNREIFEKYQKSAFKLKTIIVKGRTFKCQGYEGFAIRLLAKTNKVERIKTCTKDGIKSFEYRCKDGINHVYHPDIQIAKTIYEVKSEYTAGLTDSNSKSGLFAMLKRKGKSVTDAGFKFVLLLAFPDGTVIVIRNIMDLTRKQVKSLYK